MQSIDGTAQRCGINDLVNRHTLNYIKVNYRKLILRFHRVREKAELLAADSQEAGAGEAAAMALASATKLCVPLTAM